MTTTHSSPVAERTTLLTVAASPTTMTITAGLNNPTTATTTPAPTFTRPVVGPLNPLFNPVPPNRSDISAVVLLSTIGGTAGIALIVWACYYYGICPWPRRRFRRSIRHIDGVELYHVSTPQRQTQESLRNLPT